MFVMLKNLVGCANGVPKTKDNTKKTVVCIHILRKSIRCLLSISARNCSKELKIISMILLSESKGCPVLNCRVETDWLCILILLNKEIKKIILIRRHWNWPRVSVWAVIKYWRRSLREGQGCVWGKFKRWKSNYKNSVNNWNRKMDLLHRRN